MNVYANQSVLKVRSPKQNVRRKEIWLFMTHNFITCCLQISKDARKENAKVLESIGSFISTMTPPWLSLVAGNISTSSPCWAGAEVAVDDGFAPLSNDLVLSWLLALPERSGGCKEDWPFDIKLQFQWEIIIESNRLWCLTNTNRK